MLPMFSKGSNLLSVYAGVVVMPDVSDSKCILGMGKSLMVASVWAITKASRRSKLA